MGYENVFDAEISTISPSLAAEYRRACRQLGGDGELARLLGETGLELGRDSYRGWESALELFRVFPQVARLMGLSQLVRWLQLVRRLGHLSQPVCSAFIRGTPDLTRAVDFDEVLHYGYLATRLYANTQANAALVCQFIDVAPVLSRLLDPEGVRVAVALTERLARRSQDLAAQCLGILPRLLTEVEPGLRGDVLRLAVQVTDLNWRATRPLLEVSPRALQHLAEAHRATFLRLASGMADQAREKLFSLFTEGVEVLAGLEPAAQGQILTLADQVGRLSPAAAVEFIKTGPRLLDSLSLDGLRLWVAEGLRLLQQNHAAGLAYFRLQSQRALTAVRKLMPGLDLESVKGVLELYCRALTGRTLEIRPAEELVERGIGWTSVEKPTTEGRAVYLPSRLGIFETQDRNFEAFKVYATHQAGHLEFGTFDFRYDRAAAIFKSVRPRLEEVVDGHRDRLAVSDFERFFDLFADRRLARDLFTVAEDTRIDSRVLREYAGIRRAYAGLQRWSAERRPPLGALPLRQAFVEGLILFSLNAVESVEFPERYADHLRQGLRILNQLRRPEATVEDAAEATVRLYILAREIPNTPPQENEQQEQVQPPEEAEQAPEDLDELVNQFQGANAEAERGESGPEEEPYESPPDVEYRGDFKPELVQTLQEMREARGEQSQEQKAQLNELVEKSAEVEQQARPQLVRVLEAESTNRAGTGRAQPQPEEAEQWFYYDEWDYRARDYRPAWCRLRQKPVEEGNPGYFDRVLRTYAPVVYDIRRQFEMLRPELLRKVKRLRDGEELDFDAVVEAILEKRAGQAPSEKVYTRRNKVERDVAVAFLLDMSASTGETIEPGGRWYGEPDQGRSWRVRGKRIIDLEKESLVLLITALESIGDTYGIYGFSGHGRENVEFYIIKDMDEPFSEQVKSRIDRIAPARATRMGTAIRHAIYKLEQAEARTRILFLISDGRPQDHDYGRDPVDFRYLLQGLSGPLLMPVGDDPGAQAERQYAIHDTKKALLEAKQRNIIPFCLSIDKLGHDYLKSMCGDIGYELLSNIYALPKRLPTLYRRLTT